MVNSFKMTNVQNDNKIHPPEEKSHNISEREKKKNLAFQYHLSFYRLLIDFLVPLFVLTCIKSSSRNGEKNFKKVSTAKSNVI